MIETIKERFEKKFDGGLESYHGDETATVIAFIAQELILLAEEIQDKVGPFTKPGVTYGLEEAANLLLEKAKKLSA